MRILSFSIFMLILLSSSSLFAQDIVPKIEISQWDVGYDIPCQFLIDTLYGNHYIFAEPLQPGESYKRSSKIKRPGNYFYNPEYDPEGAGRPNYLKDISRKIIFSYIKNILNKKYFSSRIVNYIAEYNKVLNDSTRNEYYGNIKIDENYFVFSGWLGKFAVFSVCTKFSNADEFIEMAHKYFEIPSLSSKDVVIENACDLNFYTLVDRQNMLWLNGYKIILMHQRNNPDTTETNIIQLVKYFDKDFVP